ncbi:MAG: type II toxin-antitoxin system RelE/ParE family toxin [Halothiobacillaceae bacterium]|jgi:plasmid stabilization system protein ParE
MHYAVVFSPEADDQLQALFHYIAENSSIDTAHRYTNEIVETCERLARFPHRGVQRDDVRAGLRVTHHRGRTVIAYTVDDDSCRVAILGLFYGGRDYASLLAPVEED